MADYMGRGGGYQGGPPDWELGRGGYGNTSNVVPAQREGLMSYKQFIQELEDDILPSEAERRYQEYKSEYISTQKRFSLRPIKMKNGTSLPLVTICHSVGFNELMLKDKYHPTNLVAVIERRNEVARKVAKDFLLDLQSGTLDLGPGVNAISSNKSGQASDQNSDDDAETGG
ncbi:serrate RNA effector molecule [Populus alba x Populus x berolinensis]|nr:serrate RNA effector molecule [Populus alba x Populus x berolinensis]